MVKYFLVFFTTMLFFGCDYASSYDYEITNTTDKDVVLKAIFSNQPSKSQECTTIVIAPNETKRVLTVDGGICGRNYTPECEFQAGDTIPQCKQFNVYIGDSLVPNSIRLFENWEYSSSKREGKYTLRISNSRAVN